VRAAAAGRVADVDALLEGINPAKFLTDDGEPDRDAISVWVDRIAPKNDEEWTKVRDNALILAESGNLLMIGNRVKDKGDWMKMSKALTDAGVIALKAAEAKNPAALFEAGGQVYEACQQCHTKYANTGEGGDKR